MESSQRSFYSELFHQDNKYSTYLWHDMVTLLLLFHAMFLFTKVDMLAQQEPYVCPLGIYTPGSYGQPHWELLGTLPKPSILQSKAIFSSWTRGNSVSVCVWFGPRVMSSLENTMYLHGDFITPCRQQSERSQGFVFQVPTAMTMASADSVCSKTHT